MTNHEALILALMLSITSITLLVAGIQIYRGHWLHLLGGNIFGDADAELRKNRTYRRYGALLIVLAAVVWLLWWVPILV